MRSRVDLPAPFSPSTPIFAPGRKLSEMSRSTCLSGGCVRDNLYIWTMYWWPDTAAEVRQGRLLGRGGRCCGGAPGGDRAQHDRRHQRAGEREAGGYDKRQLEAIG